MRPRETLLRLVVRILVGWLGWHLICVVFGLQWSGLRQMAFALCLAALQFVDHLLEGKPRR